MDAFSAVTIMASASRQMVHPAASIVLRPPPLGDHELMNVFFCLSQYAFARDQGTPYSDWLSRVRILIHSRFSAMCAHFKNIG